MNDQQELAVRPEIHTFMAESACALGTQTGSACDGKKALMHFIDRDQHNAQNAPETKKKNADKIAEDINKARETIAKTSSTKQTVNKITGDEVLQLQKKVNALTESPSSDFAGIYINVLGGKDPELSAVALTAFLDYITRPENSSKPKNQLLLDAYREVNSVTKQFLIEKAAQGGGIQEDVQFSAAFVDKKGKGWAIASAESVVLGYSETNKNNIILAEGAVAAESKVKEFTIERGGKIILCASDQASRVDGKKSVADIVKGLIRPKKTKDKTHPASAGKADTKEIVAAISPAPVPAAGAAELPAEVREVILNKLPFWANHEESKDFPPQKASDFAKTTYFKKYVGELDASGEIKAGLADGPLVQLLKSNELRQRHPMNAGENERIYRIRLLREVVIPVLQLHGDHPQGENATTDLILKSLDRDDKFALMSAEALLAIYGKTYADQQIEVTLQSIRADWQWEPTLSVRSMVDANGSIHIPGGPFEKILEQGDGKGQKTEAAIRDIAFARIISQRLRGLKDATLDATIESAGYPSLKGKSYGEVMDYLESQIQSNDRAQATQAKKAYALARQRFYENMERSLEAFYRYHTGVAYAQRGQPEIKQMLDVLSQIETDLKTGGVDKLCADYNNSNPQVKIRPEEIPILKKQSGDIFLFAMKGAEFFERMAILPLELGELGEIADLIYDKRFIQGQAALMMIGGQRPQGAAPQAAAAQTAVHIPVAPPLVAETSAEGGTTVAPAAEVQSNVKGAPLPETRKPSTEIAPAPVQQETPEQFDSKIALAFGTNTVEAAQDITDLAKHGRAHDSLNFPLPQNFGRKLLFPFRHPVHFAKMIWQNFFLKNNFDMQWTRFAADIENIVYENIGLTRSVALKIPKQVIDVALEKAKEERNTHNVVYRIVRWGILDFFRGATSIGQTSDMTLARKWLRSEEGRRWCQEQHIKENSLNAYTAVGRRYASNIVGLSTDQTNERILHVGETRRNLQELLGNERTQEVRLRIKQMVERYIASGAGNANEALIADVNAYVQTELLPSITDANIRRELASLSLASNILDIAAMMKTHWNDHYNVKDEASGKRKFDIVMDNLTIYVGRAKLREHAGGEEMNLTTRLAARLAENNLWRYDLTNRAAVAANTAFGVVRDIAPYLIGYGIAGLGAGIVQMGPNFVVGKLGQLTLAINPFGGALGAAAVAGLREGGLVIHRRGRVKGFAGRYISEFRQLSREHGMGRVSPDEARERKILEQALVDSKTVEQLISSFAPHLDANGKIKDNLTPEDRSRLIFAIAEVQARIRLSDLSGIRRGRLDIPVEQNFVVYTEGKDSEEGTLLRSRVTEALQQLVLQCATPQEVQDLMSLVDRSQIVMEAQLRVGSTRDALVDTIHREWNEWRPNNRMSRQEAVQLLDQLWGAGANIHIAQEKSLEASMHTLLKLNAQRALYTTAVAIPLSIASTIGWGEIRSMASDIMTPGYGLGRYFERWGEMMGYALGGKPNIPVDINPATGEVISALTPLQQGVLWTKNIIAPSPELLSITQTAIDSAQVRLPPGLKYINDAAANHDYLIDLRSGKVVMDLSNTKLHIEDIRGTGPELVMRDNNSGAVIADEAQLKTEFQKVGIDIRQGAPVKTETLSASTGYYEQALIVDGRRLLVKAPEGTMKLPDGSTIKWRGQLEVASDGKHFNLFAINAADGKKLLDGSGKQILVIENLGVRTDGTIDTAGATFIDPAAVHFPAPDRMSSISGVADSAWIGRLNSGERMSSNGYTFHVTADGSGKQILEIFDKSGAKLDTQNPIHYSNGAIEYTTTHGNLVPAQITNILQEAGILKKMDFWPPRTEWKSTLDSLTKLGYTTRTYQEMGVEANPVGHIKFSGAGEATWIPAQGEFLPEFARVTQNGSFQLHLDQYLRHGTVVGNEIHFDNGSVWRGPNEFVQAFGILKRNFDNPGSVNPSELVSARGKFGFDVTIGTLAERVHIPLDQNADYATITKDLQPYLLTQTNLAPGADLGQYFKQPEMIVNFKGSDGKVLIMGIFGGIEKGRIELGQVAKDLFKSYIKIDEISKTIPTYDMTYQPINTIDPWSILPIGIRQQIERSVPKGQGDSSRPASAAHTPGSRQQQQRTASEITITSKERDRRKHLLKQQAEKKKLSDPEKKELAELEKKHYVSEKERLSKELQKDIKTLKERKKWANEAIDENEKNKREEEYKKNLKKFQETWGAGVTPEKIEEDEKELLIAVQTRYIEDRKKNAQKGNEPEMNPADLKNQIAAWEKSLASPDEEEEQDDKERVEKAKHEDEEVDKIVDEYTKEMYERFKSSVRDELRNYIEIYKSDLMPKRYKQQVFAKANNILAAAQTRKQLSEIDPDDPEVIKKVAMYNLLNQNGSLARTIEGKYLQFQYPDKVAEVNRLSEEFDDLEKRRHIVETSLNNALSRSDYERLTQNMNELEQRLKELTATLTEFKKDQKFIQRVKIAYNRLRPKLEAKITEWERQNTD